MSGAAGIPALHRGEEVNMPLGSSAEDEPGSGSGSNVIDPSNTSSGPIRRWVQAASYLGQDGRN